MEMQKMASLRGAVSKTPPFRFLSTSVLRQLATGLWTPPSGRCWEMKKLGGSSEAPRGCSHPPGSLPWAGAWEPPGSSETAHAWLTTGVTSKASAPCSTAIERATRETWEKIKEESTTRLKFMANAPYQAGLSSHQASGHQGVIRVSSGSRGGSSDRA